MEASTSSTPNFRIIMEDDEEKQENIDKFVGKLTPTSIKRILWKEVWGSYALAVDQIKRA